MPAGLHRQELYAEPANPLARTPILETIQTGIRSIDGLLTCGIGQRVGIFGGSGVGKSTLLGMIARYTNADINVIALIGERGRELREFIENDLGPEA
jgi:flagellum-specific ATP synthase